MTVGSGRPTARQSRFTLPPSFTVTGEEMFTIRAGTAGEGREVRERLDMGSRNPGVQGPSPSSLGPGCPPDIPCLSVSFLCVSPLPLGLDSCLTSVFLTLSQSLSICLHPSLVFLSSVLNFSLPISIFICHYYLKINLFNKYAHGACWVVKVFYKN